ncbi:hypothetical protein [Melittangium boletus]|uniref:Uncharacterized protein n=1 Tax=Melittangium boletus DSM 14713 TaxID=1294270 RepID=A0A250IR50_9BACT|nr:hypothetical protein [Melittangium boletus]ATB34204.1 hypothetical protein MEBOL_007705 [Melittangium boletus DSM 14713]
MFERPAFEELLFAFADPERALAGGITAPTLALAVRARAWAFIPSGNHEQRDGLNALSQPARDVTLSDIPAGRHIASLLELGPDGEQLRVRDLGPQLRRPDSPLQRGLTSALDYLHVSKRTAVISASVAALGLLYQFGTAPATNLGIPTLVNGNLFKGRLKLSFQLRSEPRFQNARADMATRIRLPELSLYAFRLEQLELGGAAARTPEGMLLDTRWANLRGRVSWLELSVGIHSSKAEPNLWMVLETGVQRERFSLRTVLSRQWETARTRLQATATLRTGPVLSGFFLGAQDNVKSTFGLVGMGAF